MHDERRRIEDRVERFLQQRIKTAVHSASLPLDVAAWAAPDEPVPFAEAAAQTYEPFAMGTPWGPPWGTTLFRVRGEVPAEWAGSRVEAVFDLGLVGDRPGNQAEALVHTVDGSPLKAVNPQNQYVPVARPAVGGERIDYLVEAASNPDILANGFRGPTPLGDKATAGRGVRRVRLRLLAGASAAGRVRDREGRRSAGDAAAVPDSDATALADVGVSFGPLRLGAAAEEYGHAHSDQREHGGGPAGDDGGLIVLTGRRRCGLPPGRLDDDGGVARLCLGRRTALLFLFLGRRTALLSLGGRIALLPAARLPIVLCRAVTLHDHV